MKRSLFLVLCLLVLKTTSYSQNPLIIPDTLSGTSFALDIRDSSIAFYPGFNTATIGVNGAYLGPTLMFNKGDSVSISVLNNLMDTTTIHWHGLNVSAENDGGPHVVIPPGAAWNPSFVVRDHASTYWYHSHLHMMTNLHATLGAAGVIIVRDSAEAALNLPRTYGVDDFPLVIQSKSFNANKQIVIMDHHDSVMMVNGTVNALLQVPAQVVRFRLLNASSERVYNLGLTGNSTFYQIGTDGGLLDAPVALTRLRLAPGERAEILVDFNGLTGQSLTLMSYASELPAAIYGAAQPGMGPGQVLPGYTTNPLNGADFPVMSFSIVAATSSNPVLTIPASLVTNTPWPLSSINAARTLTFSPVNMGPTAIQGPFLINNTSFNMNLVNYYIPYDNVELWTLTNQSPIAHPFHIHAVQFYITQYNGVAPPPNLAGRKDVVLVPAMQTVQFITKFETICDSMGEYMYHCHMLTHEDDGMMGQFAVTCPPGTGISETDAVNNGFYVYPNPSSGRFRIESELAVAAWKVFAGDGNLILEHDKEEGTEFIIDLSGFAEGLYLLNIQTSKGAMQKKLSVIH